MNADIKPFFQIIIEDEFQYDKNQMVGGFNCVDGIELSDEINGIDREVKFYHGELNQIFNKEIEVRGCDVKICICNIQGEVIASLSGVADVINILPDDEEPLVVLHGNQLPAMLPGALSLWNERRSGLPIKKEGWKDLSFAKKKAWLEVALLYKNRVWPDKDNLQIVLDGNTIDDQLSFLCALGEAIHGPGGYMGRDLGSLEDCITGGFGVKSPITIIWLNAMSSMSGFERNGEKSAYQEILSLLNANGVHVKFQ